MASRDRERMLARAKLERQQARRAAKLRKRRQRQAQTAAGLAVLLIAAGVFFAAGGWNALFGKKKATNTAADSTTTCVWAPVPAASDAASPSSDLGTPPTSGISTTGTETMTMNTSAGVITASLDREAAPCTVANFDYLASQNFFANTACTRLTNGDSAFFLLCGDPSSTDPTGGPGYSYDDENPPLGFSTPPGASPPASGQTASEVIYPAGTVAVWNQESNTNGSQFILVYKDTTLPPNYSVFGQVTSGLDVLTKIGTTGVAGGSHDGTPKTPVTISTMTVEPTVTTPSAAPSAPSTPPSPAPSTTSS
ncbi:MAG TPA: peptidylprolyl isomerase [Micromonosporaceae bacterium]|nr:peptidylprolyl isomerase [Micromonosporaceae bacterium]